MLRSNTSDPTSAGRDLSEWLAIGCSGSSFLEAIADAVESLDHIEVVVDLLELLAQPLDVAVDSAIVDVHLIVVGRIHQGIARLDDARPRRERLEDEELRDRQHHRRIVPVAGMALRV